MCYIQLVQSGSRKSFGTDLKCCKMKIKIVAKGGGGGGDFVPLFLESARVTVSTETVVTLLPTARDGSLSLRQWFL
jgi:hypothetical protein